MKILCKFLFHKTKKYENKIYIKRKLWLLNLILIAEANKIYLNKKKLKKKTNIKKHKNKKTKLKKIIY